MPSHDMKATVNFCKKFDCNCHIKKWTKIHDKSSIWCMLCNKTVARIIVVLVKLINMLDLAVIPSNQRLVFLQTNQSLRRLETTLNFAVNHCKQDIWKQNVFGHSKLLNKTRVFAPVMTSTHVSVICFHVKFLTSFQ